MSKILYAASSSAHLKAFHTPYVEALRDDGHTVVTLGGGEGSDLNIAFEKKYLSRANARSRKQVKKILASEGFDVVIVNTTLAAFHVRRALPKTNAPRLVNVVHGYLFPEFAKGLKANIRRALLLSAEKMLRKKTDAIVVMNAEDLRIAVTNNLVNTAPYHINGMGVPQKSHISTPEKFKAELGLEGKQLLTFVGELSGRKNQSFLISAMPEILKKHPLSHLLLVGDGADRDKLSALIEEMGLSSCVTLLGQRNDIADVLAATDVYVSAAKSEGLPFNVVEALAEGNQTVASAVKGHTDILEDGAGILFESENLSEYVRAVCSVLSNEKRSDERLIREAYERFSLTTVFPETYKVLKEASRL